MKEEVANSRRIKPEIIVDPKMDKYNNVVLFPEKLAEANEMLKKYGAPKLPDEKVPRKV